MDVILKYFPNLSELQLAQLAQLDALYRDWNEKINLISRKDIDHLYEHHVLHSLAIAKFIEFQPNASVLDIGTGGGFPGIPLAILFPQTRFTLIDGTLKKIKVVQAVAEVLQLKNVAARQIRAEELKNIYFDFVVSRAVTTLDKLWEWSHNLLKNKHLHAIPNGLIILKGGDIKTEIKSLPKGSYTEVVPVTDYFKTPYFEEKWLVYVQG